MNTPNTSLAQMKLFVRTSATVAISLLLSACQAPSTRYSPPPPVVPGADSFGEHRGSYPRVTMTTELGGRIVMSEPIVTRKELSNTLTVAVPLRSTIQTDLFVEYRIVFLSDDGTTQNPYTPWRGLQFGPLQRATAASTSTRADTAEWLLEIRSAR